MKKIALTTFIVMSLTTVAVAQNTKADEQSIKNILTSVETGWNEKNGARFASGFANVHDYIVVNGAYLPRLTQADNAKVHQQLFDTRFKNNRIKLVADRINFYRPDLAMVTAIGAGYLDSEAVPKDPTIIMTLLVEKQKEGWKIISFHNHELNMAAIKQGSPMPLEMMYASWYKN